MGLVTSRTEVESLLANDIRVLVEQLNDKMDSAAIIGLRVELEKQVVHYFGAAPHSVTTLQVKILTEVS